MGVQAGCRDALVRIYKCQTEKANEVDDMSPSLPITDYILKRVYQPSQTKVQVSRGQSQRVGILSVMRDGQSLPDVSPHSGACTDILAISPSSQNTEGNCTCLYK